MNFVKGIEGASSINQWLVLDKKRRLYLSSKESALLYDLYMGTLPNSTSLYLSKVKFKDREQEFMKKTIG